MNVEDPKDPGAEKPLTPDPGTDQTIAATPALGNSLSSGAATRMAASPSGATAPPATPPPDSSITGEFAALVGPSLRPGSVLASRYEILQMLGQGGMGAVYKARDRQVDRLVAVKIIRPEMAANPAILQRFIQELVLARQITHRNVIRIYDIGEAEGIKFITMEYVEGKDLRSIISERGKLPAEDAVSIVEQIAAGLSAAHAEGVIHRDLKPGNIMQDATGRIVVMDFGLARTVGGDGMTQTGMMLGTMEYMSPEQAKAEELDARSDLYALGLIFFELLSGQMPFKADSALASLVMRTQQRAIAVANIETSVPAALSNIVARCLEVRPDHRYRTADELLEDLRAWRGGASLKSVLVHPTFPEVTKTPVGKYIGAAVVAIALLIGVSVFVKTKYYPSAPNTANTLEPTVSLAIVPFKNSSGDPGLDWLGTSIAEMLRTDVGQSASLHVVSQDRIQQIFRDLRINPGSAIDESTLKRLAEFTNADTIVVGQYVKIGEQIRIDMTLRDLKRDRTATLKSEVPNDKQLLVGIDSLAQQIRQNLALSSSVQKELTANSLRPSSESLPALRAYNEGLTLARQSNHAEAAKQFEAALKEDPNFAQAYSRLAETYSSLGYDDQAEKASRKAVELSQNLAPTLKYLIAANHARIMNDVPKALESYENIAKIAPQDPEVQLNLANLYETASNYDLARQHYAKVVQLDPKNTDALLASGRVEIRSGNPQNGLDFLGRALSLAIQLDNQEQKASILQATGVAYRLLNKPQEALQNYQESLAIKKKIGQKRGIAVSLNEIAIVQTMMGHTKEALAAYKEGLAIRREIGDKKGIGDSLIDLGTFYHDTGDPKQALTIMKEALQAQRELGNERNQALCLNNIGSNYLDLGQYDDALTFFQQALQLREKLKTPSDIAETLHNMAETNVKLGQYDLALSQYLKSLENQRSADDQHGAALESSAMANIFAAQGRFGAAINTRQDALKIFRSSSDTTFQMVEVLGGYGHALSQAGKAEMGQQSIEEALKLARELKHEPSIALALIWLGDSYFYRADYNSARQNYERALQIADKIKDKEKLLTAKVNLAKTDIAEGKPQAALPVLSKVVPEADQVGLKYLSLDAATSLAQAQIDLRNYKAAQASLDRLIARCEKMNVAPLTARSHFLLGSALRLTGNTADAKSHYGEALRVLDGITKEVGSENALQRADFKAIYTDASKWARN
jgi:eukaryotic-like serine/threonine-protein kinase